MHEHQVIVELNCLLTVHSTPNYIHGQNTNQELTIERLQGETLTLALNTMKILKSSIALLLIKTLFNSSLWYCMYTLQYSAKKKQNVQLHKYKILPPCLMAKTFREVQHDAVMNPAKTKCSS